MLTWLTWLPGKTKLIISINLQLLSRLIVKSFIQTNTNCDMIKYKTFTHTMTDYFHAILQLKQKQKLILKLSHN